MERRTILYTVILPKPLLASDSWASIYLQGGPNEVVNLILKKMKYKWWEMGCLLLEFWLMTKASYNVWQIPCIIKSNTGHISGGLTLRWTNGSSDYQFSSIDHLQPYKGKLGKMLKMGSAGIRASWHFPALPNSGRRGKNLSPEAQLGCPQSKPRKGECLPGMKYWHLTPETGAFLPK